MLVPARAARYELINVNAHLDFRLLMDYSTPLTPEDLLKFNACMKAQGAMQIPQLHGYLTAIITSPIFTKLERWVPWIWKDSQYRHTHKVLPDIEASGKMFLRLCDHIATHFEKEGNFAPLLSSTLEPYDHKLYDRAALQTWCRGYLQGVQLASEADFGLNDEQFTLLYIPILVLASDDEAVKEHFGAALKNISLEELRAFSAEVLPDTLADIHDYWCQYNEGDSLVLQPTFPKIGDNDPCPCGSGKKYKKCCLQKMMN